MHISIQLLSALAALGSALPQVIPTSTSTATSTTSSPAVDPTSLSVMQGPVCIYYNCSPTLYYTEHKYCNDKWYLSYADGYSTFYCQGGTRYKVQGKVYPYYDSSEEECGTHTIECQA